MKRFTKVILLLLLTFEGYSQTIDCSGIEPWISTDVYTGGEQVIRNGNRYQANYWTQDNDPESNGDGLYDYWLYLGTCSSLDVSTCDADTPSETVDLTSDPAGVYLSERIRRTGNCCGNDPHERPPVRCVEFLLTLHDNALGIIFDIASGAVPPGALYYQINCAGRYQFGELLCLSGPGPFRITFCEPGNNPNTFMITSVPGPEVSPPITVSDGCSADIFADGYDLSTVVWTSVPSNPLWESYMSCTSQCDSVRVTWEDGAPDSVVYQVSGYPPGGCLPDPVVLQTVVYFVNDKLVDIQPREAMVCFGNTGATLTAYPTGGRPPYRYIWSNGDTTQSVTVGAGDYSVEVFDDSSCPTTQDSVTVGAFLFPIVADAGPNQSVCKDAASIQLDGSIEEAGGGLWFGGSGDFSPDDTALDAVYTPSQTETDAGTITLTLYTIGNRSCPRDNDEVTFTFDNSASVVAPDDLTACQNNPGVSIDATYADADGVRWLGNGGSFLPNDSATSIFYTPSSTELTTGTTTIFVSSYSATGCPQDTDTIKISFFPSPTLDIGSDTLVCASNGSFTSTAILTVATGVKWSSSGTGYFTPSDENITATYNFSSADTVSGSVTISASTTDNQGCLSIAVSKVITFAPDPILSPLSNITVCETAVPANLTASFANADGVIWSGSGVFSDPNSTSTTYNPTALELNQGLANISVTTTNFLGCVDQTESMQLFISSSPQITVPPSITVCENITSFNLSASIADADSINWTTTGAGSLSSNFQLTNTYTIDPSDVTSGSIQITATTISSNSCPDDQGIIAVTFTSGPIISAGPPQTICSNTGQVILDASITSPFGVEWVGGTGTFSPTRLDSNALYVPSATEIANGTVTLTVVSTNNFSCTPTQEDVIISILLGPSLILNPDISICADQSSVLLGGVMSNSAGGSWTGGDGSHSPDINTIGSTYTFGTQDKIDSNIILTYATSGNTPCPEEFDNLQILLTAPPVVSAGNDQFLCEVGPIALLNGGVAESNSGTWSTLGDGVFSDPTDLTGTYTPGVGDVAAGQITLTLISDPFGSCNIYSDQMTIFFVVAPVLTMDPDINVCTGDFPVSISVSGSPGSWSGAGVFDLPLDNQVNQYIPSSAEITANVATLTYTTLASGVCASVFGTMDINMITGPELTIPSDITICANTISIPLVSTINNAMGIMWTTNSSGTFNPGPTSLNFNYVLSTEERTISDTLVVLLAAETTGGIGGCSEIRKTLSLTLVPRLIVIAGNSGVVCTTTNTLDLDASIENVTSQEWRSNGAGSFSPDASSLSVTYTIDPTDYLIGSVEFILESNDVNSCSAVSDTIYYDFEPQPLVDVPATLEICQDVTSVSVTSTSTDVDTYYWTTSGDGFFGNETLENTDYFRSVDDTNQVIDLVFEGQGSLLCPVARDTIRLSFTPGVIIDGTLDFTVCSDTSSLQLNSSIITATGVRWEVVNGTGTFDDSLTFSPIYSLSTFDASLDFLMFSITSTGNGVCIDKTESMTVTMDPVPTIVTPQAQICEDQGTIDLNSYVTNATGTNWTAINAVGSITSLDAYSVQYGIVPSDTVIDSLYFSVETSGSGVCNPQTDTLLLVLTDVPSFSRATSQVVCIDESFIDLTSIISPGYTGGWVTSGDGAFSPDITLSATKYFISDNDRTNGSILLTVTASGVGGCNNVSQTISVTFEDRPVISPIDASACAGLAGVIPLNVSVINASSYEWKTLGTGTFSPDEFTLNASYLPSVADQALGSITVRLIASSCTSDSVDLEILFLEGPTATVPDDQDVCMSQSVTFIGTRLLSSSGVWSTNGSGQIGPDEFSDEITYIPSYADQNMGTIELYFEAVSANGCPSDYDTVELNVLIQPSVNSGSNQTICSLDGQVVLSSSVQDYSTLLWTSNGTGSFSSDTDPNPTYQLSAADDSIGVLNLTLTAEAFSCFPNFTDVVSVTIEPEVLLTMGLPQDACSDAAGVVFNASSENANNLSWSSSGTGSFSSQNLEFSTYTFSAQDVLDGTINISITATSNGLCPSATDNTTLTLNIPPLVDAGVDQTLCLSTLPLVDLNGEITGAATEQGWVAVGTGAFSNPTDVLINSYQATSNDTLSGRVRFILIANENSGCLAQDEVIVYFEGVPNILIQNTAGCEGDTLTLIGQPVNISRTGAVFSWYKNDVQIPNETDSVLIVSEAGTYRVEMIFDQCIASKEAVLDFHPDMDSLPSNSTSHCVENGGSSVLTGDLADKYYWYDFNDSSRVILTTEIGSFTYLRINSFGCRTEGLYLVEDICPPGIFYPSIFTPNGDGDNDYMVVAGKYITEYDLTIFSRWGEIIFHTNDLFEYWDGTYLGEDMPEGVYNWIIVYKGGEGEFAESKLVKGIITIVR